MTQAATQNTPAPAPPAATPAPGGPAELPAPALPQAISASQTGIVFRMPTNAAEMRGFRQMRSELSDQLQSAARRREDLASELASADPGARQGLQQRIDLLVAEAQLVLVALVRP